MHDFLNSELIKIVGSIFMLVLSATFCFISNYFSKRSKVTVSEINNSNFDSIYYIIERVVEDCVEATNQTFVNNLKKSGDFTIENQKEAFNQTLTAVKNIISNEVITDKINIEELIKQLIEKTVARKKLESSTEK